MKYFIYTLLALAFGLLIFNLFQVDYSNFWGEVNGGALVGILASACVIVIMLILMSSRAIQKKTKERA